MSLAEYTKKDEQTFFLSLQVLRCGNTNSYMNCYERTKGLTHV